MFSSQLQFVRYYLYYFTFLYYSYICTLLEIIAVASCDRNNDFFFDLK